MRPGVACLRNRPHQGAGSVGAGRLWLIPQLLPARFSPLAGGEVDCKPGPVPASGCPGAGEDHSSRRRVAAPLEHSHPDTGPQLPTSRERGLRAGHPRQRPYSSLLRKGLASPPVTRLSRVGSYPTISPLPVPPPAPRETPTSPAIGGVISVALSLGSPRVGVTDFPALRSPDFPPANGACSPAILRPPPAG